ncbi:4-hydroxy-3-methylbut-2-enyl diphosphate reductase [compost metagenome]
MVNQTTMLASDTQGIAEYLKQTIKAHYQLDDEQLKNHFADTRDTLCYATNDNQNAVTEMLQHEADIALVIGGYNSSNTSHLVELCQEVLPTYFINNETCLLDENHILHFVLSDKQEQTTADYTMGKNPLRVMITSGASCPDAQVENVIRRLVSLFDEESALEAAMQEYA